MSPADWHILWGGSVKDIWDIRPMVQMKYLYQCIVTDKLPISIFLNDFSRLNLPSLLSFPNISESSSYGFSRVEWERYLETKTLWDWDFRRIDCEIGRLISSTGSVRCKRGLHQRSRH
jgi:hypothetical protein